MHRTILIAVCSTTLLGACAKPDQPGAARPGDPAAAPEAAGSAAAPVAPPASAPAATAATPGGNTALENKGIAMMQQMGDMFAADATDCEKLAVDIKAFIAQNKPLIAQLNDDERKQTEAHRNEFEARNKNVQDAVMQKMNPALTACGSNANVQAAMKEFPSE